METLISAKINRLETSATLAMAAKARKLKQEGKDIIGLSLGQPDFNTPDFIKEAAIQAIEENYNSYTPVDGYGELKEAIIKKFKRDNHLDYQVDQIVVSTGAKQTLYNIAAALLNPGDEVILPCPYWVSYRDIVKLNEGKPIEIKTSIDQDFKLTPEQLETHITDKTKMIWYSSPCNPSGSVYTKDELQALADVLSKYPDVLVISDEIYEHINFGEGHVSMASIPGMKDRTITVNGVSKAFAMTGWRIGYMAAPPSIAKACTKLQGQVTSGANCIAQRAVITALTESPDKIQPMIDIFEKRRKLILDLLADMPGFETNIPQGAFYVFPNVSAFFGQSIRGRTIKNATDFSFLLLEEAHVATVTGEAFGNPDCIRISYAASDKDIKNAIQRIQDVVAGIL
ncbi:MAG: pyridoxal phosphate-dependent aminotransferase [Psychroflexus sp.]|nr:pyridoxal phosphate-dependent aminotransferase [Psychroflexus sp.]